MNRRVRAAVLAVAATAALVAVTGCSGYNDERGKGDAPVQGKQGDDSPAEVFNFPDGFGNLATKCVGHGNRAYVTTNNDAPSNVEIVQDPTCGGTGATATPGGVTVPSPSVTQGR